MAILQAQILRPPSPKLQHRFSLETEPCEDQDRLPSILDLGFACATSSRLARIVDKSATGRPSRCSRSALSDKVLTTGLHACRQKQRLATELLVFQLQGLFLFYSKNSPRLHIKANQSEVATDCSRSRGRAMSKIRTGRLPDAAGSNFREAVSQLMRGSLCIW